MLYGEVGSTDAVQFFEAMREKGVATIDAEYSGAGDEGWIDYVNVYDADGKLMGDASERQISRTSTLGDTALGWIDQVIAQTVGGYENNEGGGGEVHIKIGEGIAQFDHYSYGEPVAYPEPFRICVNVDTGEETVEDLSKPEESDDNPILRRKAAAWDVMSAALNDHARRLCTATEVIRVGRRLQEDVSREGSTDGTQDIQHNDHEE